MPTPARLEVAQTIADQIGRPTLAMLGAHRLCGGPTSLSFRIGRNSKGIKAVIVTLDPSDTYTVRFVGQRDWPSCEVFTVSEVSWIYCDQLSEVITDTAGG